jgi:hypothetical protein
MLLEVLENEWSGDPPLAQRELISMLGAYVAIAFCGLFRGNEVFLVDLFCVRKYLQLPEVQEDTIIIPLLGCFKGETGERYHLTPLAASTASGIQVWRWVERLSHPRRLGGACMDPCSGMREG